jgi:hypothetical protein
VRNLPERSEEQPRLHHRDFDLALPTDVVVHDGDLVEPGDDHRKPRRCFESTSSTNMFNFLNDIKTISVLSTVLRNNP